MRAVVVNQASTGVEVVDHEKTSSSWSWSSFG